MYPKKQFYSFKKQLKERYLKLVEKSNNYRFEDEVKSDIAAFKAMKVLEKMNRLSYLERKLTV
ncbi:hypothetical protein [Polaribacter ponticola]|uniref:Lacal_2735 family protein n=1 Tax=Polaribacter ponticola TaxID=2978475 RepID=A0ABT5S5S2_9FLAO|nr:hypothetical protein [Polaribacter sp. MSW5]MDD7913452.1 hypothetical protein [Polaribacter sp. MSW5]